MLDPGHNPQYLRSGHVVYVYQRSLFAVPFDLDTLEVKGSPVPVIDGIQTFGQFATADDGTLVYISGGISSTAERSLVWVDREGHSELLTGNRGAYSTPKLSPDGTRLALSVAEGPQATDIWILDLAPDRISRLTLGATGFFPVWTPEGKRVAFSSGRDVFWMAADGSEEPKRLIANSANVEGWAPDGRLLLFSQFGEDTSSDLWTFSPETGESQVWAASEAYDSEASFSPDGRWVAYTSEESGTIQVYVRAFSGSAAKRQISVDGGREPVWTKHGGEIVYRNGTRIMSVATRTKPNFEASQPRLLFEGPFELERQGWRNFDVTADGERFVMIQPDGVLVPDHFIVVFDWLQELERSVPTGS